MMKNVKIKEKIYLVGKIDDRDVPFHRLTLTKGTTYNSYLLLTEKPTIIDTVDISFGREYIQSLKNLIKLRKNSVYSNKPYRTRSFRSFRKFGLQC